MALPGQPLHNLGAEDKRGSWPGNCHCGCHCLQSCRNYRCLMQICVRHILWLVFENLNKNNSEFLCHVCRNQFFFYILAKHSVVAQLSAAQRLMLIRFDWQSQCLVFQLIVIIQAENRFASNQRALNFVYLIGFVFTWLPRQTFI